MVPNVLGSCRIKGRGVHGVAGTQKPLPTGKCLPLLLECSCVWGSLPLPALGARVGMLEEGNLGREGVLGRAG